MREVYMSYARFGAMIATSTILMFVCTSTHTRSITWT